MARKKSIHYVNNADFSQAIVDYVIILQDAKKKDTTLPIIPDYIAQCFLRIAEGLSHKANFIRYTYREEMVMDAVENCLKAIANYNLETATRTGKPNAFSYFTQITWFAFLRRIAKEKKQQDIKMKFLTQSGIENFIDNNTTDEAGTRQIQSFVDTLKDRIEKVKHGDQEIKDFKKKQPKQKNRKKKVVSVDSDLGDFIQ